MDWTLALQHNHTVLLRSVGWLFTWLGLAVGGSVETLPKHKRLTVLFVLRPSESACRRLVLAIMYVRGVVAAPRKDRAPKSVPVKQRATIRNSEADQQVRAAAPSFKLTDTRKHFDLYPNKPKYLRGPGPRICAIGYDDPRFERVPTHEKRESETDEVSANSLCWRLNALMGALNDLDAQALRMAKLHQRMKRQRPEVGQFPIRPLRPGLPPGMRQRRRHEVDEALADCHQLARMAKAEFPPP